LSLNPLEEARELGLELSKETLEAYLKTQHGSLDLKARQRLKRMGYKIIKREQAPEWIRAVGAPDIIAVKDGEYALAEVKTSDQLKRYSTAKAKLILVTDVEEGKAIEVWGMKELSH
jgi:Holliday junction resolvase-like predicted endonuclease